MIKQVIVMRKDLNMRKGKMTSQGSHACMKVFFDRMEKMANGPYNYLIEMTPEMAAWKDGIFTKICVSVSSEEELLNIYNQAREGGIPCAIIQDQGHTEFHGVPTYTCCAIGPDNSEKIDPITGGLPLL